MKKCKTCNKNTTNPKFCNQSCAATYNNKKFPKKTKKKVFCKRCDSEIISNKIRTVCDTCKIPKDMTLEESIYENHHKSSTFALVRTRARSFMKDEIQVCENCGYDKHVEVCHIKSISSFNLNTLISKINDKSNLKLLCPNCHWEFDNL